MLFAMVTNLVHITNGLALVLVAARVLQSSIHMLSTGVFAVQLRFVFFLVQFGIGIYWLAQFLLG